jgi:nicotinate-nucleotide adenylyltransferase
MTNIGILAGAFDPIHLGHIEFIDRTIASQNLDKVLLLIEKKPQHKKIFADYNDRKKMVELAVATQPKVEIFELDSESFPLSNGLPAIKKRYPRANLKLLIGSDVAKHIKSWENSEELLNNVKIVVAERGSNSKYSALTSGKIRDLLPSTKLIEELEPTVQDYIANKKIYS